MKNKKKMMYWMCVGLFLYVSFGFLALICLFLTPVSLEERFSCFELSQQRKQDFLGLLSCHKFCPGQPSHFPVQKAARSLWVEVPGQNLALPANLPALPRGPVLLVIWGFAGRLARARAGTSKI